MTNTKNTHNDEARTGSTITNGFLNRSDVQLPSIGG